MDWQGLTAKQHLRRTLGQQESAICREAINSKSRDLNNLATPRHGSYRNCAGESDYHNAVATTGPGLTLTASAAAPSEAIGPSNRRSHSQDTTLTTSTSSSSTCTYEELSRVVILSTAAATGVCNSRSSD
jgi:hypothetical protein